VQVARAVVQAVEGSPVRQHGSGAVAQGVVAVVQAALQGLRLGAMQQLGLAEQLAQGVVGQGDLGSSVAGADEAAQRRIEASLCNP